MNQLKSVRYGVVMSLVAICFGFGLGGMFGAFEDNIKDNFQTRAKAVRDTLYHGDQKKIRKTIGKSWSYLKRAHLHANGIGTASLSLIILLSFLTVPEVYKKAASIILGLGSIGYPLFWFLAGWTAPAVGGTHAAKESLEWLAVPSAFLCLLGLALVVAASLLSLWKKDN